MGEKTLVDSQVDEAIALIQKLDSSGNAPTLAAWYYYDDAGEWRLIIAGPAFDPLLKTKQEPVAYQRVVEAMAELKLSSLTTSEIKIVSSESPLPQALRMLMRTAGSGIVRARFADTTLNGIFIKEMMILRSV